MKCLRAMVAVTRANMDRGYFPDLTAVPEDLNTIPDIRWANSKFLGEMVLKALQVQVNSNIHKIKTEHTINTYLKITSRTPRP